MRRELAHELRPVHRAYDDFEALPRLGAADARAHATDRRPFAYSREQLEAAQTHDRTGTPPMTEMRHTGYMHNSMRMYWGKKILEWSRTPPTRLPTALELNNEYFLDGRDPTPTRTSDGSSACTTARGATRGLRHRALS